MRHPPIVLRAAFDALTSLLYPARCACCGGFRDGALVCAACVRTWQLRHESPSEDFVAYVVSDWESPTRDAVRALKFNRESWRGAPLGDELARHAAHRLGDLQGILPVPVHRVRLRERGFNQCDRLAKGVSRRLKIPVFNALSRCDELRQSELSSEERAGVRFRCKPLSPGRYLIVDDLITTGHTLLACAHAAEDAGATEVLGLALCRAERRAK